MAGLEDVVRGLADKYLGRYRVSGSGNIQAICPFHNDSPKGGGSFTMHLETGVFNCYGCHVSGPLTWFLYLLGTPRSQIQKIVDNNKTAFSNAERKLRKKDTPILREAKMAVIPEEILGVYDRCPNIMLDMGFNKEFLKDYEVGYDDISNRIIYPLRSVTGLLVAIGGRTTALDVEPKFKWYVEELKEAVPSYQKSGLQLGHIFNYHRVYPSLYFGDSSEMIIVEGQKDTLWWCHQGFPNTGGLLTSTVTRFQLELLARVKVTLYFALDNDNAGFLGTYSSLKKLAKFPNLSLKVLTYPEDRKDAAPEQNGKSGMSTEDLKAMLEKPREARHFLREENQRCQELMHSIRQPDPSSGITAINRCRTGGRTFQ
jgi:DNA primase